MVSVQQANILIWDLMVESKVYLFKSEVKPQSRLWVSLLLILLPWWRDQSSVGIWPIDESYALAKSNLENKKTVWSWNRLAWQLELCKKSIDVNKGIIFVIVKYW